MITYSLSRPLYQSLYLHIRQDIESGLLPCGTKLPSRRQYALDLSLSLMTVVQAIDLLEQEGYVITRPRQGVYVAKGMVRTPRQAMMPMVPLEADFLEEDSDFPADLWFKTMRRVMSSYGRRIMHTSPHQGSARLRNGIAAYLRQSRGMDVQPRQVIIAAGAQELYTILCRMFGTDFHVALASESYPAIEQIYAYSGATIEKLDLDEQGISIQALEQAASHFLHVSPFYATSLGEAATPARRKAYLDWISQRQGYLIEDDFNSEFVCGSPVLQTLYALDDRQKVIYLNTFSKTLSSSLRLGYMILPESLLEVYEKTAGHLHCTVTMLAQYTLAEFIEDGSFERLVARKRRAYSAVG